MGTQNGNWLAAGFHFHVFGPDRVRYNGALAIPYVNIKYYSNNYLSENPVQFNMNALTLIQHAQIRIAESDFFVGASYVYYKSDNSLDTLPNNSIIKKTLGSLARSSNLSMIQPIIN